MSMSKTRRFFSLLLTEFNAFTADERRRCELLEQHTRDAEEGRVRTDAARARVAEVLNRRLLGKVLPRAVVLFLQQAWSQVLLLASLKYGEQSVQWQAALRTMDELIWSVSLPQDTEAGGHLVEQLPGLLKALRDGLTSVAFDPFSTRDFFCSFAGPACPADRGCRWVDRSARTFSAQHNAAWFS